MKKQPELKDYADDIKQCVKCGTCHAYCPIFDQEKREPMVARGKVTLAQTLLNGEVEIDKRFMENISKCLLCGTCADKCPNLVPVDEIVMASRREIAKRKGLTLFGTGLSTTLKSPALMKLMLWLGKTFSWLVFRKVPEKSGLRLRFPAPYIKRDRTIPKIAPNSFRDQHPEFIPGDKDKPQVVFFTGCMVNFMYPHIGDAAIRALKFLGINIHIPKEQGCCGVPALSSGDGATVDELTRRNFNALAGIEADYIVTACASCNAGLRGNLKKTGEEGAVLAAKVIDIHRFLVDQGLGGKLAELPPAEDKVRVTYHDPCHLRNQGITREPRAILHALPAVEFVEMKNADQCCGLGGTFSVYHYGMSQKIGAKKAAAIAQTDARLVATACPGCMMQLLDSINHAGQDQQVCHVLELLASELEKLDTGK
ncbi:MAG: (Fe-S)-binding protein [Deltaproteobacteria bacterium]|nr:(Fe-S)-binding protein [Deltaproteobacteria bacterium]